MAKFHFFHSVMNAGKSLQLLQAAHSYESNGSRVLLLTSAVDDRGGVGRITSRLGPSAEAVAVRVEDDVFAIAAAALVDTSDARPLAAVLIDEVQFMTAEHVWQASRIVDELCIPVMAYGLKDNVFGTLFGPAVETLLAIADDIKEIKQLCHCGRKANMILRYGPDGSAVKTGNVVEVGGDSRYVSVCRAHWKSGDIGEARRRFLSVAYPAKD